MIYDYKCTKCTGKKTTDFKDGTSSCQCGAKMELVLMYGYEDFYDTSDRESCRKKMMPPVYRDFKEEKKAA
jgi:hypothetical protein